MFSLIFDRCGHSLSLKRHNFKQLYIDQCNTM